MAKTYTIEQIRKYLLSQDSRGDMLYNLKEEILDAVNTPTVGTDQYNQAVKEYTEGYKRNENPYSYQSVEWYRWDAGWEYADNNKE